MSASFFCIELVGGERPAELLAVEARIGGRDASKTQPRRWPPGDAGARHV
jgi:hypothetical protein